MGEWHKVQVALMLRTEKNAGLSIARRARQVCRTFYFVFLALLDEDPFVAEQLGFGH